MPSPSDRLAEALKDRYTLERELGRGGNVGLVGVLDRARHLAQETHGFRDRELPSLASRARSDSPLMKGMVKHGSSPTSPAVSSGTMWGCCNCAASAISRLKPGRDLTRHLAGQHLDHDLPVERRLGGEEEGSPPPCSPATAPACCRVA
jgi:hypothetical protein